MPSARATKAALARELGVSRSSLYYRPRPRPPDGALKAEVEAVMAEHGAYGHRRIAVALGRGKKAVRRVMRKYGLRPRLRRRFRPERPDDVGRPESAVPNVLDGACPIFPGFVWAGDFTYVWFAGRFWYVATVIDVRTREIVGWHVANHHTAALVMEAFRDAVRRAGRAPDWFHSDRGSEYDSEAFAALLALHGTRASMSRKGRPWQNGFQESFYSNFKLELGDVSRFAHEGELVEAVHGQIAYYNNRRIHSALGMPPVECRKLQERKIAAVAASTKPTYSLALPVESV